MTASITVSLLRCALLLPRFRRNRRKPDYSRPIDDLAVGIEARSMTRTIPRFFRVVPMNYAVKMSAHRRVLVDVAPLVAIHGDLASAATDDGSFTGFDRRNVARLAGGEPILVLLRDVGVFLD